MDEIYNTWLIYVADIVCVGSHQKLAKRSEADLQNFASLRNVGIVALLENVEMGTGQICFLDAP